MPALAGRPGRPRARRARRRQCWASGRPRCSLAGKAHRPAQIVPKQLKLKARRSDITQKPITI
jgi:hypothetical protein